MKKSSVIFIILILIYSSVNIFAVSIDEGIELFYKGEYEASKKIFEQIHSTEKGKISKREGLSLKFLGNIYWQYYDYRTAERFYIEALQIFNSLNDNIERANTLNNLGTIYMMLKDYNHALESYNAAKEILGKEKDFTGVGHILLNIAVLYEKQEKYKDAEKIYFELSKLIEEKKIEDPELLGNLHLDRGKLFFRLDKPEDALKDFVKANFIYTKAKLKIGIVISLINMGITQRRLKNYETAVKLLNRARRIIEEIRGDISLERSRATFLENKIFVYEQLASLYIILNQNELSFKTVERAKAKTFVDLIGSKVVGEEKYSGEVKRLIKKEKELSFKIASKIDKEDVSSLISEQKNILNQLKQQAPEYSNLKIVTPISINQLYNILGKDIILVDYFLGTEVAFVFILKEWTLKVVVLKKRPWEIEQRIRKFRQSATGAKMNILDKSWQDDLHWLYKALFEPLEEHLSKDKLICIVPHRMLHHLPFNALVTKKDKKSKQLPKPEFLIEKYKILVLPTASMLYFLGSPLKKPQESKRKLVLANAEYPSDWNELKHAEEEARELKVLYPETEVKIKSEATETYLRNNCSNFDIIHLATHGILHPDKPLESKILLTKDSMNDGFLTVREIFNLDIKASLIILSACESGKFSSYTSATSKQLPYGDDVVGLTRALVYAGAPFIISSLWEINDKSTKSLFLNFYKNLEKDDYINAFRNAQIELMKSELKYSHPNYWAPFQIYY